MLHRVVVQPIQDHVRNALNVIVSGGQLWGRHAVVGGGCVIVGPHASAAHYLTAASEKALAQDLKQ
jgi:hypothetical protein